jgi:hypothetical protein
MPRGQIQINRHVTNKGYHSHFSGVTRGIRLKIPFAQSSRSQGLRLESSFSEGVHSDHSSPLIGEISKQTRLERLLRPQSPLSLKTRGNVVSEAKRRVADLPYHTSQKKEEIK